MTASDLAEHIGDAILAIFGVPEPDDQDAVMALNGKGVPVAPYMSAGATDGAFFREAGIPVYGMDGSWVISPEDERAHGLDERMPVRAVYDNVLFWEMVLKRLAG